MRATLFSVMISVCFLSGAGMVLAQSCPNDSVCETYTYDVHGRLEQVDRIEKDSGGTTVETVEVIYEYDDAGNRVKKETDVTP